MIEIAVEFLGAYLVRKASGLLDRATSDADRAFTAKLGELYTWVKTRLAGSDPGAASLRMLETVPEGADQRAVVEGQLEQVVSVPAAAAELSDLVEQLRELGLRGALLRGWAYAQDVQGTQTGLWVEGELPSDARAEGVAVTGTVSGTQTGLVYRPHS